MDGKRFLSCLSSIVGEQNANLYAARFQPLDEIFFETILNYEGLAFYTYTTSMNWHQMINSELWSGRPSSAVQQFTNVLNGALDKVTPYKVNQSLVYRGYQADDLKSFLKGYAVGTTFVFPGFTSAAYKEEGAFGGNVLFIIRTLTGRVVWHFSANFGEYEILIPAGRSFLVIGLSTQASRAVINLEEQR